MIQERELDAAVAAGIVDAPTRDRLLQFARDHRRGEAGADEEQFRLLTGFNDIFVTIAIGLVLTAVATLAGQVAPALGAAAVAAASWGLAEYFTRQRRMALPSIVLLLIFVGAVFAAVMFATSGAASGAALGGWLGGETTDSADRFKNIIGISASAAAVIAAYLHWRRFMVPITVAAGAAALSLLVVILFGGVIAAALGIHTDAQQVLLPLIAVCGVAVFLLAMWFDGRDRVRVTRRTDVAFWLHLLAAPMIVHPVFALTGLSGGSPTAASAAVVILVYAALTAVALAIDRRALLVSALVYVIYAIQALVGRGGDMSTGFALTALIVGLTLVLLAAAWGKARRFVLTPLPEGLRERLPPG